jgi:hypothetical protein
MKCELWQAANSRDPLPYYTDDPVPRPKNESDFRDPPPKPDEDRRFHLLNIFQEIEYVAEAQFTLDVTDTGGVNPSIGISEYNNVATSFFPATGFLMSVNGTYSDSAHQYIQINSSIDFARLVEIEANQLWRGKASLTKPAKPPQDINGNPIPDGSCDESGSDLQGYLGLKEKLALGLIASAQNDIALFPHGDSAPPPPAPGFKGTFTGKAPGGAISGSFAAGPDTPSPAMTPGAANAYTGGNVNLYGLSPAIPIPTTYPFGQFSAQIDFTIIENANGGPTWTTRYFKGPGGASAGLLSFNRQVKDTLLITFVPVCIREKYYPRPSSKDFEYEPPLVNGTPGWANFLSSCGTINKTAAKAAALVAAKFTNSTLQIQPLSR